MKSLTALALLFLSSWPTLAQQAPPTAPTDDRAPQQAAAQALQAAQVQTPGSRNAASGRATPPGKVRRSVPADASGRWSCGVSRGAERENWDDSYVKVGRRSEGRIPAIQRLGPSGHNECRRRGGEGLTETNQGALGGLRRPCGPLQSTGGGQFCGPSTIAAGD